MYVYMHICPELCDAIADWTDERTIMVQHDFAPKLLSANCDVGPHCSCSGRPGSLCKSVCRRIAGPYIGRTPAERKCRRECPCPSVCKLLDMYSPPGVPSLDSWPAMGAQTRWSSLNVLLVPYAVDMGLHGPCMFCLNCLCQSDMQTRADSQHTSDCYRCNATYA